MKLYKKIIIAIISLLLIAIIIFFTLVNIEGFIGHIQNSNLYNEEKIEDNQKIVFLGDSITNGYIADGGLFSDFQGYRGEITDDLEPKGISATNYAVGGYVVDDVLNQVENNISLNDVNKEILDQVDNPEEIKDIYKTNNDSNLKIEESLKEANAVIITIGANDLIEQLLSFDENGNMSVEFDGIFTKLNSIRTKKEKLYNVIKLINPDIEIYDVGIYFAYPHQSDFFTRILYPILMVAEKILFIDDDKNGIHFVKIRDNMQDNIKENVSNPKDIHPSRKGHKIIANEVLKEMEKYN